MDRGHPSAPRRTTTTSSQPPARPMPSATPPATRGASTGPSTSSTGVATGTCTNYDPRGNIVGPPVYVLVIGPGLSSSARVFAKLFKKQLEKDYLHRESD